MVAGRSSRPSSPPSRAARSSAPAFRRASAHRSSSTSPPRADTASISRERSAAPYTVTTRSRDETKGGVTRERLRAAGTQYPAEVAALFDATLPPDALGPESRALLQRIVDAAPAKDPYDIAVAIRDTLRDGSVHLRPRRVGRAVCRPVDRRVLRQDAPGILSVLRFDDDRVPARARHTGAVRPGFPPRQARSDRHRTHDPGGGRPRLGPAYFPGYGWVDFDPTGGPVDERPQLAPIPSGALASGSPTGSGAVPSLIPERPDPNEVDRGPSFPVTRTQGGPPVGLFIGIAILLAVVVGSIAAVAWRRSPHGPVSPNDVYGSVARLAGRLGFGPRPTQTVYEYAGALGDELPMVRRAPDRRTGQGRGRLWRPDAGR